MNSDLFFPLIIFILFFLYGFSNLYIIIYFRKEGGHTIGLLEFITIFLGNIKNYVNMNKEFKKLFLVKDDKILFNKCVAVIHLFSPILIPLFLLYSIFSIGFY